MRSLKSDFTSEECSQACLVKSCNQVKYVLLSILFPIYVTINILLLNLFTTFFYFGNVYYCK